jgi:hypothetical protein
MTIADGVTSPTAGRMFQLRVEQIPTYTTQPPVLVLRIA